MVDTNVASRVHDSLFFRQIPEQYLAGVEEICREVEFPAHTTIFKEYERSKDVYVILSGKVSLLYCEPKYSSHQIAIVGEGDLVGWSPLVGRPRLSDTAVTLTPVKAIVFDGNELLDMIRANPAFGVEVMRLVASALATRLGGTRLQLHQVRGNRFPSFDLQPETD